MLEWQKTHQIRQRTPAEDVWPRPPPRCPCCQYTGKVRKHPVVTVRDRAESDVPLPSYFEALTYRLVGGLTKDEVRANKFGDLVRLDHDTKSVQWCDIDAYKRRAPKVVRPRPAPIVWFPEDVVEVEK